MSTPIEQRAAEWLKSGKTGASSKTMHDYFTTGAAGQIPSYPHDSGDFGRCLGLLDAVPEWRVRLPELANVDEGLAGQVWAKLANMWEQIEAVYAEDKELCTRMIKAANEPLEQASGQVADLGNGAKIIVGAKPSAIQKAVVEAAAGIGHNSGMDSKEKNSPKFPTGEAGDVDGVAGKRLLTIIQRVERMEEEKSALAEDIKEIYAEAKATGFDAKTIRKIVRLRKMETEKRREEEDLMEVYKAAIGME